MGGGNGGGSPQLNTDFVTDPYDTRVRGFDTSGQKAALMRDFSRAGERARAQTLASQAQALGGSRSTGTAGMLADIAAQQGYGQQKALADLDAHNFEQRVSLMDMVNNVTQAANAARTDMFNMRTGRQDAAQAQQQASLDNIFKLFGAGAKATTGGWA